MVVDCVFESIFVRIALLASTCLGWQEVQAQMSLLVDELAGLSELEKGQMLHR